MLGQPKNSRILSNRLIKQEDLIELLALKTLYEQKRRTVTDAIESGAEVESGVHSFSVVIELVIR
jgi:hypothetical protein